jgi:hypothetical protein
VRQSKKYSVFERATVAFLVVVCGAHPALAGTQGAYMSSTGFGKAVDSISITFEGETRSIKVTSPSMNSPCAAVNPQSNFICVGGSTTTALPPRVSRSVYCQSKGFPNYIWSIQAFVSGGATADNPELDERISVTPADCAEVVMESEALFHNDYSGQITVNAYATHGAAIWLRGFEFLPGGDPGSLETLKEYGRLRFDLLLVGPFDLKSEDCTALTIPFTTETGHENLYFVVDTVAKSNPFEVTCPGDVVYACGEPVVYPSIQVSGGCGEVTVAFDPPPESLGAGATAVTAIVTDESGNEVLCNFTAVRETLAFQGFDAPIGGTGGSCTSPLRSIRRGSDIPIKFSTTCDGSIAVAGIPTFQIVKCSSGQVVNGGSFKLVSHVWHANWDTAGLAKGVYEVVVTLQDGSTRSAFLELR